MNAGYTDSPSSPQRRGSSDFKSFWKNIRSRHERHWIPAFAGTTGFFQGVAGAGGGAGFGISALAARPEPMIASARNSIGASAENSAVVPTAVHAG